MLTQTKLFGKDEIRHKLVDYCRSLENFSAKDSDVATKARQLFSLINIIISNTDIFDSNCQHNIEWMGQSILSRLYNLQNATEEKNIDWFLAVLYRFVVEFDLSIKNEMSMELKLFQSYIRDNLNKFESEESMHITYARQEMCVSILKTLLNHDAIGNLKNVSAYSTQIDQKIQLWDASLNTHEKTVLAFQNSLESHKTAFNFVGLYDGFNNLAVVKKKELFSLRVIMCIFGLLLIAPLVAELYYLIAHQETLSSINPYFLGGTALITLSLTLLLMYFFRLVVRSTDACKAQLLQVELRKTLCRFIQSYATYSKDIKDKNPESLAKFESLIFSGIVSSDEKLPSTFDGIDQMANFVKAMRKGST